MTQFLVTVVMVVAGVAAGPHTHVLTINIVLHRRFRASATQAMMVAVIIMIVKVIVSLT